MGNFLAAPITEKETHRGKGNGLEYGISAMQGWRVNMEDSHVAVVNSKRFPEGSSVFAVCDGHGGKLTADLAAERMVDSFGETMEKERIFADKRVPSAEEIGQCMRKAFMSLDQDIRDVIDEKKGADQSGCTAISAFISSTHVIVANSGDSRSVLAKGGRVVPMSSDHKPMLDKERKRIEKAGGSVRANRVNGDLAVSRALGDFTYKQRFDLKPEEQQVSAEPDIQVEAIDKSEEFLVIACDGIWDVMTNEDVCENVRDLMGKGESDMGLIAEEILDMCLRLGSRDNMSVVIVKFPAAKIGKGEGVAGVRRLRAEREQAEDDDGQSRQIALRDDDTRQ